MQNPLIALWFAFPATLFLWHCSVVGEGPDLKPTAETRRIFANDKAANDSLNRTLTDKGIVFYIQPKAGYSLLVQGSLSANSKLYLVRLFPGWVKEFSGPIVAQTLQDADGLSFPFSSPFSETGLIWGVLLGPDGEPLPDRVDDVNLIATGAFDSREFGINYYYYGSYSNYYEKLFKNELEEWHKQLTALFQSFNGIALKKSGPWQAKKNSPGCVSYQTQSYELPALPEGEPNFLNVIFADCITMDSSMKTILGFSPREATGINSNPGNRLIISLTENKNLIVFTLAHELGHFFGLRHIVATDADLKSDEDLSNRDDGFSDTELCRLNTGEDGGTVLAVSETKPFCLRRLATAETGDCSEEAKQNLMYPFAVRGKVQNVLSQEQIKFLQSNIGLLKH